MGRIIVISDASEKLAVRHSQLVVTDFKGKERSAPIEDLDTVIIDTWEGVKLDSHVLKVLAFHGTSLIVSDEKRMPHSILLPLYGRQSIGSRLVAQIGVSKPTQKRIWQAIVRQKIRSQAANLGDNPTAQQKLISLSQLVLSGDSNNMESQTARLYWRAIGGKGFLRGDENQDGLNAALNYGYAIMRATVARLIVATGLHPSIGIHHKNASNPFCLADDLMEPLRPFVDKIVFGNSDIFQQSLSPITKKTLLKVLQTQVSYGNLTGPLSEAVKEYVFSFSEILANPDQPLVFPIAI